MVGMRGTVHLPHPGSALGPCMATHTIPTPSPPPKLSRRLYYDPSNPTLQFNYDGLLKLIKRIDKEMGEWPASTLGPFAQR